LRYDLTVARYVGNIKINFHSKGIKFSLFGAPIDHKRSFREFFVDADVVGSKSFGREVELVIVRHCFYN
jgi:hypothetical protein